MISVKLSNSNKISRPNILEKINWYFNRIFNNTWSEQLLPIWKYKTELTKSTRYSKKLCKFFKIICDFFTNHSFPIKPKCINFNIDFKVLRPIGIKYHKRKKLASWNTKVLYLHNKSGFDEIMLFNDSAQYVFLLKFDYRSKDYQAIFCQLTSINWNVYSYLLFIEEV